MRFNEILDPNYIKDMPDHWRNIASNYGLLMNPTVYRAFEFMEMVKRDCQPYLTQSDLDVADKDALYRGVVKTNLKYITKRVRLEDRKPKDIPLELHQEINKYFTEHYGAPFRNALFATSDIDQAGEYAYGGITTGELYIIFPVGRFKFLWSPRVNDLLDKAFEFRLRDYTPGSDSGEGWSDDMRLDKFKDGVLSTYQTTDLHAAIKSGHEVAIRCERYHGVRAESNWSHEYYSAFGELLRS